MHAGPGAKQIKDTDTYKKQKCQKCNRGYIYNFVYLMLNLSKFLLFLQSKIKCHMAKFGPRKGEEAHSTSSIKENHQSMQPQFAVGPAAHSAQPTVIE